MSNSELRSSQLRRRAVCLIVLALAVCLVSAARADAETGRYYEISFDLLETTGAEENLESNSIVANCSEEEVGGQNKPCVALSVRVVRGGSVVASASGQEELLNSTVSVPITPLKGDKVELLVGGQLEAASTYRGVPTVDPSVGCGSSVISGEAGDFEVGYVYHHSINATEATITNGRYTANSETGPIKEGEVVFTDFSSGLNQAHQVGPDEWFYFTERVVNNFVPCPIPYANLGTMSPPPPPPAPPPNHPPTAHKDAGESTGHTTSGNVLANDTDPDGDPLTLTSHTQGAFGKVDCSRSGDCTYTPGKKYTDDDSFSYTISDGRGGTSSARDFIRAHPLPSDGLLVLKQSTTYDCGYLGWSFSAIEEAQFSFHVHDPRNADRCSYAWLLGPAGGRVKTPCPPSGSRHYIGPSLKTHVSMDGIHPLKVCAIDKQTGERFEIYEDVASPAYLYAPAVYLANGESYRPGSTNEFLEHSRVVLDKPDEPTGPTPGVLSTAIGKLDKSCDDRTLRPAIGGDSPGDLAAAKRLGKELAGYAMHPWSAQGRGGTLYCAQESKATHDLTKADDSGTGVVLDADPSIYPGATAGELSAGHVPVYVVYVPHRYVSYWFFYPYNGFDHKYLHLLHVVELHQGDWEHITVDLHKGANTPDEDEPTNVDYYQHIHCQEPLDAELEGADATLPFELTSPDGAFEVEDGTHPVLYSALGGHASYPEERHGREPACGGEGLGDVANRGQEWDTWKSIDDATRQSWWGFTGNWGSKVSAKGLDVKILHLGPQAPGPNRTR